MDTTMRLSLKDSLILLVASDVTNPLINSSPPPSLSPSPSPSPSSSLPLSLVLHFRTQLVRRGIMLLDLSTIVTVKEL